MKALFWRALFCTLLGGLLAGGPSQAQAPGDSIVVWGRNIDGECNVPSPNVGFTAASEGCFHGLGLKADGSINDDTRKLIAKQEPPADLEYLPVEMW